MEVHVGIETQGPPTEDRLESLRRAAVRFDSLTFFLLTRVRTSVSYRQPENTPATEITPRHNAELTLTE